MKKVKLGIFALVISLVFTVTLSACGTAGNSANATKGTSNSSSKASPSNSSSGKTASNETASNSDSSTNSSNPYANYPGLQAAADFAKSHPFDKQMKITVFNPGSFVPTAPIPPRSQDPQRQMLEKAVNIDFELTVAQPSDAMNKLNTMAAAGDLPDLIFFTTKQDAAQYLDQGLIVDVSKYINNYPDLVNRFTSDEWNDLKYKGATLGMPGYDLVGGINGWWIRNDWLKKLDLPVPTTSTELLNVMKAFTFNDPDGDKKNDTYGFAPGINKDGAFGTLGWQQIMWMFGVANDPQDYLEIQNGKLTADYTDPRMKQALAFAKQMLDAKVVDPDWVSINDNPALNQKFYKGMDGIMINDWRQMEPSAQSNMKKIGGSVPDWIQIAPPAGPDGNAILSQAPFQNNLWAISAKAASDPEKVNRILTMLDFWYADKAVYPYFAYGIKDVTWDEENGKVHKLQPSSDVMTKYQFVYHYMLPRRANDATYFNYQNPVTAKNHELNMKYVIPNPVTPFVVPESSDTMFADRQIYVNEELLKFMNGKEPLNSWNSYVQTLNTKFQYNNFMQYASKQLKDQGILK